MEENNHDHIFELSLLENGIDFILKGIDELFDEDFELRGYVNPLGVSQKGYKYGVLSLFSGFLLLLKERLHRHMPELIFAGKIADVREKIKKNKFINTVDFDEIIERLEIGPRVSFAQEDMKIILRMRTFRNELEHYRISINKYEMWSIVSGFLGVIDNFLTGELRINIEESTDDLGLIGKIQHIEAIWRRIEQQRIDRWRQDTERLQQEFQVKRDDILAEIQGDYRHSKGALEVFIACPNCYEDTLIAYGEYAGICTNEECGEVYPITTCDVCGRTTTGFSWDFVMCDDCRTRMLNNDD